MRFVTALFILLYSSVIFAQEDWLVHGKTWHYSYSHELSTGFIEIVCTDDTAIDNKDCKILKKTKYGYTFPGVYDTVFIGNEIIHVENDKVELLRFGKFFTLYDFNPDINDIWQITGFPGFEFPCDSAGYVKVDSVSEAIINNTKLREIHTSPVNGSHWYFSDKIIEGIGCKGYLLPLLRNCAVGIEEGRALRCYEDEKLGLFSTGISASCTAIEPSTDTNQKKWFEENTLWHYGILLSPLDPSNSEEYASYEVIGDTIINDNLCSIIKKLRYKIDGSIELLGYEFYSQEGDKVYYFQNGQKHLLYDFSLSPGESWMLRLPNQTDEPHLTDDTLRTVQIDSTGIMIVNSDSLRVLYTSLSKNPNTNRADWQFNGPIIEKIGSIYLMPGKWWYVDSDIPYLRCYKDSEISYIANPSIQCDSIISFTSVYEYEKNEISITRISSDMLYFQSTNPEYRKFEYKIFDVNGSMVGNGNLVTPGNSTISLSEQDQGIYIIIFISGKRVIFKDKFFIY